MSLLRDLAPDLQISAATFAGRWFFCDDGWLGTLTLRHDHGPRLSGTFFSERFDQSYDVAAQIPSADPYAIDLVIREFNWQPEQHYSGRLLTRTRNAMAGRSIWQGEPFGFFATRAGREPLGTFRSGVVRGEDFAGSWTAYLDGEPATIKLEFDAAAGNLLGSCTVGDLDYQMLGRPGGAVAHAVALQISSSAGGGVVADLAGLLMTRPKNAISGMMTMTGGTFGFIMIRYA